MRVGISLGLPFGVIHAIYREGRRYHPISPYDRLDSAPDAARLLRTVSLPAKEPIKQGAYVCHRTPLPCPNSAKLAFGTPNTGTDRKTYDKPPF